MARKRTPKIDLNPSSADRWTTCTASPTFIFKNWDRLPPHDTFYNQEGTSAHEVGAAFLQDRKPDETDKEKCPIPVNAEMRMHGWDYAEYVQGLREPGSTLLVEHKFPLFYMEGRNAIVDAAVLNPDNIHIVDFKYGEGIIVDPVKNLQESIYAIGLKVNRKMALGDDFPTTLHIYQPRGRDASEPFRIWETTWGELRLTMLYLVEKAKVAQLPDGESYAGSSKVFAPSDKACQWCPAKGFCEARQKFLTQDIEAIAVIDEKPLRLPSPDTIGVEQMAAVLKHGKNIEKWLGDVADYALSWIKGGGKIPGYKLVLSRGGNRYWSNSAEVAKELKKHTILKDDEIYEPRKVIGPAAVEKLLGKNHMPVEVTNLIAKPPGSPVIAPADDKREEYAVNALDEFSPVVELEDF